MAIIKTLSFSESAGLDGQGGWTSFWDYEPSFAFSVRGVYFTTKLGKVYKHYSPNERNLHGYFYETYYPSEVTLIINEAPSNPKNFKTLNYEGSNGWEATLIETEEYSPSSNNYGNSSVKDSALPIKSYSEGKYIDLGVAYRAGFDRKENKYYANIKGNGVILREGSVTQNNTTSGLNGIFCTFTFKTDQTTDTGGKKQLFAVSSEYVPSS